MTRILVIEDNEDLAFGLRNNLEIEGYQVDAVSNGEDGLEAAAKSTPDLVLLDLMLPKMDGFRVLHALRQRGFSNPVLILTARGEEADKVRGLQLGADDYVTKPFGVLELLARIEALLRRSQRDAAGADAEREPVLEFGDVTIDRAARTVHRGGEPVSLTPKEFDLLIALLERKGAVANRVDLMKEVWGYQAAVLSRTVDTHIAELRRKIERDQSDPVHILTVRKAGYRLQT